MLRKHALKVAALLGMAMTLSLFVPKQAAADDYDDPPSRVARLAYAQGSVSFQPGGTDDWVAATINRPITTGDKLWSDNNGRIELQLDGSTIHIANNTGFSFLNLGDHVTQIRLTEGRVDIHVRRFDTRGESYEVDTPNLAFSIYRPGNYRVTVNQNGDSTAIRIRNGEGEVTGGGTSYTVRANDYATFSGTDQLEAYVDDYNNNNNNNEDDFDRWSSNRDRRYERSTSSRYVSSDVVGYEDLDDHGTWGDSREYGHIWYPRVTVANWAPYHYGHWAYIEPWGYTWVDDEPWGFAPFHYGRWANIEGRWGWIPSRPYVEGVAYVRPVYAPALVAFVGGSNFSIGVSIGGGGGYGDGGGAVGWFPLGPREVYVPSYRTSPRYVENVNVSNTNVNSTVVNNYYNTTVVNNNNNTNTNVSHVTYVNQNVPGAVVATTPQAFTSAQSVSRNVVRVDQKQMATAPVRVVQPTYVPTKQAVLGTSATTTTAVARPPEAVQQRAVVAKVPPPPPPPAFEKRQEAIKSNGGKPLSVAQIRQIQPAPAAQPQAAVKVAPPPAKPAAPIQARGPQPNAQQPNAQRPGQPPTAQQPNQLPSNQQQPSQGTRPGEQPQNTNRPGVAPNATQQNRPGEQPQNANRPGVAPNATQQNRPGQPQPNQPVPPKANEPQNRPTTQPNTAQPNVNQPGNRPNERPADRPVDRPGAPNTVPPQNRPGDRPVTPNTAQPGNRPADRPTERPADRPVTRPEPPAARPAERPAPNTTNTAQPGNRPVDRPTERPADRPVTRPEPPAARPAERPAPNTAQPANRPADRPTERPADRPATRSEPPAARPAERPAPQPTHPTERPADRPATRPEPPAARPAERPAERPADRPAPRPEPSAHPSDRPAPPPTAQQQKEAQDKKRQQDKDKEKPPKG